ncbi:MAG: lipopolysaccharide heptosyltransferase II [Syntrophobacteraceae bacterium]|nr:lipopolysaccharide heptosyltransferase II [Syntrophobacteraceae bacterium]
MKTWPSEPVSRILIRSTNWIGDAVMTTPAMGAVRATFPDATITVVAPPAVAGLFSPHPFCDEVIVFDRQREHRGMQGLWGFSRQLRGERFDLAILFQNAIEAAMMAYLARIPIRMGYRTDGRGLLLTHGVPIGRRERRLHHTDYYRAMLEQSGIQGGIGRLLLRCKEDEMEWAGRLLSSHRFWIGINPGAAYGTAKRWFPERFAEVADSLARKLDGGILITGGPGEAAIARDIESALHTPCLNLAGKTSVRQLMAVIARCGLFVTNDSGPMHVAAAFGIPIVALFGSTDPTTTSPLSDNARIVKKPVPCAPCLKRRCPTDHACMESITVADVLEAVESLKLSQ